MGKIVYLMGKSSSGKDTIYKHLLSDKSIHLQKIILYTTRPIRVNEEDGVEYHFTDEEGYKKWMESGRVVEHRAYHTYHGLWRYFTVDDGKINLNTDNYVCIGTPDSFLKIRDYYGKDKVIPVMIDLDDGVRLQRALDRERKQENPKYEEMCRRFLSDSEDFSEEKLKQTGSLRCFSNDDLEKCINEIKAYISCNL